MVEIPHIEFPEKLKLWREHDLAKFRPAFYKSLRHEDELCVWNFIEREYLLRYQRFIRIEFEWAADGIWGLPFPGSVSLRGCFGPEDFGLSDELAKQLACWHRNIEDNYEPWEVGNIFNFEQSDIAGLEIAKKIKASIGESIYLEYTPFQELFIDGSAVIELPVPNFKSICKNGY